MGNKRRDCDKCHTAGGVQARMNPPLARGRQGMGLCITLKYGAARGSRVTALAAYDLLVADLFDHAGELGNVGNDERAGAPFEQTYVSKVI